MEVKILSEDLLTVKDVAELTGISEYTIRKRLRDGEIEGECSSDREGYRISRENLANYLQKNKKPLPMGLFPGALCLAASGIAGLGSMFLPMASMFALSNIIAGGVASNDKGTLQDKDSNSREILNLSVGSLKDQIEAIQYSIQALELKEELSVEDKRTILTSKAQIKLLERQIKELKLKYEMNQN